MSVPIFHYEDLLADPDALHAFADAYVREGGVVVSGVFTAEEIANLQAGAEHFAAIRADGEPPFAPHLHIYREEPAYARLVQSLRMLQLVEILAAGPVEMLQAMMYFKPPGYWGFNVHQDNFYLRVDPPEAEITTWVAIDDADEVNGCLHVWPRSHELPILEPRDTVDPGAAYQPNFNERSFEVVPPPGYQETSMPIPAGGVGFIHGNLLHSSNRNVSPERFRRAVAVDYIRKGAAFRQGIRAKRLRMNVYSPASQG